MAPGLFSKFIKRGSPSHSRAQSDASGSSQSSRKSSSTLPSQKVPPGPITPTIKIDPCAEASRTSLGTQDSGSSQIVTVVVEPPSPHDSVLLSSYSECGACETWEDSTLACTTSPAFSGSCLTRDNTSMPKTSDFRPKRSASSRSLHTVSTPETTTRDPRQRRKMEP